MKQSPMKFSYFYFYCIWVEKKKGIKIRSPEGKDAFCGFGAWTVRLMKLDLGNKIGGIELGQSSIHSPHFCSDLVPNLLYSSVIIHSAFDVNQSLILN